MTLLYGLGHRPDPPHVSPSLRSSVAMSFESSPAVEGVRPFEFIRQIRDQKASGSCVGQGFAQAFACRARAMGFTVPEISALAIYRMARQGDATITDDGCQPYMACEYVMTRGIVPEARWPLLFGADNWTPSNVNDTLPLDVWEHALDATISEIGVVNLADQNAVQAAINAGFPVCWATQVDAAFDNYTSGYLPPPTGTSRGSHYTCIVDYDDQGVVVVNSWGTGWGAAYAGFSGGFYRASWARLADPSSTDGRIVEVGPRSLT